MGSGHEGSDFGGSMELDYECGNVEVHGSIWIYWDNFCDGTMDCPEGDDEEYCESEQPSWEAKMEGSIHHLVASTDYLATAMVMQTLTSVHVLCSKVHEWFGANEPE